MYRKLLFILINKLFGLMYMNFVIKRLEHVKRRRCSGAISKCERRGLSTSYVYIFDTGYRSVALGALAERNRRSERILKSLGRFSIVAQLSSSKACIYWKNSFRSMPRYACIIFDICRVRT